MTKVIMIHVSVLHWESEVAFPAHRQKHRLSISSHQPVAALREAFKDAFTWRMLHSGSNVHAPASRPLRCRLPPAVRWRWKPLLYLTEIHASIFRSCLPHRQAVLVTQRPAESQPIALLKRLQSGVPVSCEYGTTLDFHGLFLPEPRDLELRVRAGLLGDVTENCELLGSAHIHLHIFLGEGEVEAY